MENPRRVRLEHRDSFQAASAIRRDASRRRGQTSPRAPRFRQRLCARDLADPPGASFDASARRVADAPVSGCAMRGPNRGGPKREPELANFLGPEGPQIPQAFLLAWERSDLADSGLEFGPPGHGSHSPTVSESSSHSGSLCTHADHCCRAEWFAGRLPRRGTRRRGRGDMISPCCRIDRI